MADTVAETITRFEQHTEKYGLGVLFTLTGYEMQRLVDYIGELKRAGHDDYDDEVTPTQMAFLRDMFGDAVGDFLMEGDDVPFEETEEGKSLLAKYGFCRDDLAVKFLESRGYYRTEWYEWVPPAGQDHIKTDEWKALAFLRDEWDYGLFAPDRDHHLMVTKDGVEHFNVRD